MAIGYLDDSYLEDIADAIRAKTGDSSSMSVADMPDEIASISGGGGGGAEGMLLAMKMMIPDIYNTDTLQSAVRSSLIDVTAQDFTDVLT